MNNKEIIKKAIKNLKDFPKPGIIFRDVTTLLLNPNIYQKTIDELVKVASKLDFDVIAAPESRGFWFAIPVALQLKKPFVPIRKKGKLPRKTISAKYELEYGFDTLEIHKEDIKPGQKVLYIDDVTATGGTLLAAVKIFKKLGAKFTDALFLIELDKLPGRKKAESLGLNFHSVLVI